MATVSWSTSIQISGGPSIAAAQEITAEATDRVDVPVAASAADKVITIQPGGAASVQLLLIAASDYGDATHHVTFKVSDGATDTSAIRLSGPQLYSGGAISLFGMAPTQLKVSNGTANEIQISVFVARDATP